MALLVYCFHPLNGHQNVPAILLTASNITHPRRASLWCHTLTPRSRLKSHIKLMCIARVWTGEKWRTPHRHWENIQALQRTGLSIEKKPEFWLCSTLQPKKTAYLVFLCCNLSFLHLKSDFSKPTTCSSAAKNVLKLCSFVFQVAQYLLDLSFVLDEESMYEASLRIEPKVPNWWGNGPPHYLHC